MLRKFHLDALTSSILKLGYELDQHADPVSVKPPPGRKLVFLGDLVDRGPKITQVLKLVMGMVEAGTALCVPGNHDVKLMRKLRGKDVQITHGLAESLAQLELEPPEFRTGIAPFIDDLVSHYVLDDGKLVVAHAGMKESMQGRGSGKVREFALYGETTGETDEFGLPVRYNWAAEYRGKAMVVYGHTPVPEPAVLPDKKKGAQNSALVYRGIAHLTGKWRGVRFKRPAASHDRRRLIGHDPHILRCKPRDRRLAASRHAGKGVRSARRENGARVKKKSARADELEC